MIVDRFTEYHAPAFSSVTGFVMSGSRAGIMLSGNPDRQDQMPSTDYAFSVAHQRDGGGPLHPIQGRKMDAAMYLSPSGRSL